MLNFETYHVYLHAILTEISPNEIVERSFENVKHWLNYGLLTRVFI